MLLDIIQILLHRTIQFFYKLEINEKVCVYKLDKRIIIMMIITMF